MTGLTLTNFIPRYIFLGLKFSPCGTQLDLVHQHSIFSAEFNDFDSPRVLAHQLFQLCQSNISSFFFIFDDVATDLQILGSFLKEVYCKILSYPII